MNSDDHDLHGYDDDMAVVCIPLLYLYPCILRLRTGLAHHLMALIHNSVSFSIIRLLHIIQGSLDSWQGKIFFNFSEVVIGDDTGFDMWIVSIFNLP